jgi:hypothetical protein
MRCFPIVAVALVAACGLLAAPSAAKDFGPGDLRVCGRHHCVPIMNAHLARIMSDFYWGDGRAPRAGGARRGAPGFELRFGDDYASGMVATKWLNRFRAYGFYCGRFERAKWYRLPPRAAAGLRKLTAGMRPQGVTSPPPSC